MATDPTSSDSGDGRKGSRTSAYLHALKIPAIFLLAGVGLLAGYYSIYVRESLEYLKGRDLRILSTLGTQIESSIDDHEKVLSSFANYYGGDVFATRFNCIAEAASRQVAMFAYVSPEPANVTAQESVRCDNSEPPKHGKNAPSPALRVRLIDGAGRSWTRGNRGTAPLRDEVAFNVDVNRMLAPLFDQHAGEDVFDGLVLITAGGRVIYSQSGSDLRVTSLDGLSRRQPDGTWKEQVFVGSGHVSEVVEVLIAGKEYGLYLQPCCAGLTDSTHAEKDPGWIVAGLVDSGKMRRASLAVSFSVMAFLGGIILLAIFSWPFVKLQLMGPDQRLRQIDVLGVGICGLLGLVLVLLFSLDWYSYARLEEDLDWQLETLSENVQRNVDDEITHAYAQLVNLDQWSLTAVSADRVANVFTLPGMGKREEAPYPFFEVFALIDKKGSQLHKWAVADFTTPLVPTASRQYFRYWLDHAPPQSPPHVPATWTDQVKNAYAHTFLESIRSATTGRREAVLSTPSARRDTVAALTIPMASLNGVVLPPGFSFAVIDGDGRVLFHSDPRHGLGEEFFLESDSSRRLRSAVAARRRETLRVRYFGQDYRAHVSPLDGLNGSSWSVVTLVDTQLTRTVNIEWLATTMLFAVIYAVLYITVCIVVLVCRPAYRAPWIWPDPARRREYQHLVVVYFVFAIAFVIAIDGLRGRHLLAFAWITPFIVWIATYVTLSRAPGKAAWRRWPIPAAATVLSLLLLSLVAGAGTFGVVAALLVLAGVLMCGLRVGPRLSRSYRTAALALLVLTAVMPTVAFFQVAHTIQVDSYVKYGQLTLAKAVQRQGERSGADAQPKGASEILRNRWSRYDSFFYDTRVVDANTVQGANDEACPGAGGGAADQIDPRYELPKGLEDLLPYYSESSVGMRELLHDRSSDGAWDWHRDGSLLVLHTPRNAGWSTACVRSELPAFAQAGVLSFDTASKGGQLLAFGTLALFAVLWLVRFTTRRVFLSDVVEPLWARHAAAIPMHPGDHLYIVWRPADRKQRVLVEEGVYIVDLEKAPEAAGEWFAAQRDRFEQLPSGQTIVIDHLERQTIDAAFDGYKLALVRDALDVQHRTVVLVSAVRPSSLVARIAGGTGTDSALLERRWTTLLARFTVLDGVRFEGPAIAAATVTAVTAAATAAAAPAGAVPVGVVAPSVPVLTRAANAQEADPVVWAVWQEVSQLARDDRAQTTLDLEQIYEEVGDRLDNYHRGMWESCSADQKRVLQHLAQEGLINEKNRRTVRLLLARGLIRKNPNFRFVGETFRRFVL